ncbi:hypothetical protein HK098_005596 [Nowakowskiella sp. JEL0407]|nr:hypothetical protein HK098_005596 [Nowakowskiella sp. JEL0407]
MIPNTGSRLEIEKGIKRKDGKFVEIPAVLDGFFILNQAPASDPDHVFVLKAESKTLRHVIHDDLSLFTNLHTLYLGENNISSSSSIANLSALPALRKLYLPLNGITDLDLDLDNRFNLLEELDLSYNSLSPAGILVLAAAFPNLRKLDLTNNGLNFLPPEIGFNVSDWRERVIEYLMPEEVAKLDIKGDQIREKIGNLRESRANSGRQNVNLGESNEENGIVPDNEIVSENEEKTDGNQLQEQQTDDLQGESLMRDQHVTLPFQIGFPKLKHLILEKNNFSDYTAFEIVRHLPCLEILNLNHNKIASLEFLAPTLSTPNAENVTTTSSDGFEKLEELAIAYNKISTPAGLMGCAYLPKLARIFVAGNPIMKNSGGIIELKAPIGNVDNTVKSKSEVLGHFNFNPFEILQSVYNILIVDPIYHLRQSVLDSSYYKLTPQPLPTTTIPATLTNPVTEAVSLVQRPTAGMEPSKNRSNLKKTLSVGRRRPHFIGHILKSPAGAILHRNRSEMEVSFKMHHMMKHQRNNKNDNQHGTAIENENIERPYPHKVSESELGQVKFRKTLRRNFEYTDEYVKKIIRMGRILTLSELETLSHPRCNESISEDDHSSKDLNSESMESPNLEYKPDEVDNTFLTGIYITEKSNEQKSRIDEKKIQKLIDFEDDFEVYDNYKPPHNIQQSLRELRYALSNPVSYWRTVDATYTKPTLACLEKYKDNSTKNHESNYPGTIKKMNVNIEADITDPFIRNVGLKDIHEENESDSNLLIDTNSFNSSNTDFDSRSIVTDSENNSSLSEDDWDSAAEWNKVSVQRRLRIHKKLKATVNDGIYSPEDVNTPKPVKPPPSPWENPQAEVVQSNFLNRRISKFSTALKDDPQTSYNVDTLNKAIQILKLEVERTGSGGPVPKIIMIQNIEERKRFKSSSRKEMKRKEKMKRVRIVTKNGKHSQGQYQELYDMIDTVDRKLQTVETNLAKVISTSKYKKTGRKLFEEVQAEMERLGAMYMT